MTMHSVSSSLATSTICSTTNAALSSMKTVAVKSRITTSCSAMSTAMALMSLPDDATVKLPRRATSPALAEKGSSGSVASGGRNDWSSRGTETTLSSSSRSNCREAAIPAAISPTATAVTRSTNTVNPSVSTMTSRCSRCTWWIRLMNRQSMMSHPTFIRMPARAAWGIASTYRPRPSTSARSIPARMHPETGLRPPALMLTTVPSVAPAPGNPQMNPAIVFPMPWPISSRLGLCRVLVMASATRDVSRLSMEPSRAKVRAGVTALARMLGVTSGNWSDGSPVGTSPITGVFVNQKIPNAVPAARAARVGGKYLLKNPGHNTPTARVATAIASAWKFTCRTTWGSAFTAATGPPMATGAPMKGRSCSSMIIIPIPDMNPEITE